MSHQDPPSPTPCTPPHQALKEALDWLVSPADLSRITVRTDCSWTPRTLSSRAMLWVWSDAKSLTARCAAARTILAWMAVTPQVPATTYQAFLKMVTTWTVTRARALGLACRRRMRADRPTRFLVAGYPLFGVDGSRRELPRTASQEQR